MDKDKGSQISVITGEESYIEGKEILQDIEKLAVDPEEAELAKEIADAMRSSKLDESIFGSPRAAPSQLHCHGSTATLGMRKNEAVQIVL